MSITPITPPATGIESITWELQSSVAVTESIYSYAQQAQANSGQRRAVTVKLQARDTAEAKEWVGFFLKLNGRENRFFLSDTVGGGQNPTLTRGTPLVSGAAQTGSTIFTDGWTASTTVLKAGEWVSLRDKLHQVRKDVVSDTAGEAWLDVWPAIVYAPLDNEALEVTAPQGTFRLVDEVAYTWTLEQIMDGVTFSAVEAPERLVLGLTERETQELTSADSTGWTTSSMDVTVDGTDLKFAATSAPAVGYAERTVTLPASGDFIIYLEAGAEASAADYMNFGLHDGTNYRLSCVFNYSGAAGESERITISGRKATTTTWNAGPVLDTTPTRVKMALHYDAKHGWAHLYVRQKRAGGHPVAGDDEWAHYGAVECDGVHTATTFRVQTGGGDAADGWLTQLLICRPNIMCVGDSLVAGHNFHDPDPSVYPGDDSNLNAYPRFLLDLTEGQLVNYLPVIRAVGSQDMEDVDGLLAAGITDLNNPPIVFLGLGSLSYANGYTHEQQAREADAAAKRVKDYGGTVLMTNVSYYGPAHVNYPAGTNWHRDVWDNHMPYTQHPDVLIDSQAVTRDGNDEANGPNYESDDVHLSAAGYELVGGENRRLFLAHYRVRKV